jgi:hypothetical protein
LIKTTRPHRATARRLVPILLMLAVLGGVNASAVTADAKPRASKTQVSVASVPTLGISPTSALPGATVTASGTGFARNSAGSLALEGTKLASLRTDRTGSFQVRFSVPALPGSTYQVVAVVGTATASTPLLVTSTTTTTAASTTTTTTTTTTTAPTMSKATTRPVGSAPLSDAEAAARVRRSSWEPRPSNATANATTPTASFLAEFRSTNNLMPHTLEVSGAFTGTTDEILQWAAHKWGVDEDVLRAVAVVESNWYQDAQGDHVASIGPAGTTAESFGITQVKYRTHLGTWPMSLEATAFNADYWAAAIRYYFDGHATWLNDPCCAGATRYAAGDLWGAVGAWYSGRWHDTGSSSYQAKVQQHLSARSWEQAGF